MNLRIVFGISDERRQNNSRVAAYGDDRHLVQQARVKYVEVARFDVQCRARNSRLV